MWMVVTASQVMTIVNHTFVLCHYGVCLRLRELSESVGEGQKQIIKKRDLLTHERIIREYSPVRNVARLSFVFLYPLARPKSLSVIPSYNLSILLR